MRFTLLIAIVILIGGCQRSDVEEIELAAKKARAEAMARADFEKEQMQARIAEEKAKMIAQAELDKLIAEKARLEEEKQAAVNARIEEENRARAAIESLPTKVHTALSCASNFGKVVDLSLISTDIQNENLILKGDYSMQGDGFFESVKLPGYFSAVATKDGQLLSVHWKEQEREGNVKESCL